MHHMQRKRNWYVWSDYFVSDSEWRYHWHQWGWHNSVHRYIIRAVHDLDELISQGVCSCKYVVRQLSTREKKERNKYPSEAFVQHVLDSLASKEETLLDGRGVLERGI